MGWPKMLRRGVLLCGVLVGCSSDGNNDEGVEPAKAELKCHATVLESDLESELLKGDLELEDGPEYIVSSTYGVPKRGTDGEYLSPRYQALMGMIVEKLQTQPGLLALQVSSSRACGSGRTLAVWESEELMYDFVTTGAHLEAMSSAEELLEPGYAVTHWTASTREQVTLTAASKRLADYFE